MGHRPQQSRVGEVGRRGVLGNPPVVFCDSDRLNFVKRTKDIFDVPGLRIERVGTDCPGIEPYPPCSHRVVILIVPNTIERADGKANVLCSEVLGGGFLFSNKTLMMMMDERARRRSAG